jgi:hypothetical protein
VALERPHAPSEGKATWKTFTRGLRADTSGDWPLNVFDEQQAAAQLPILRAMASS